MKYAQRSTAAVVAATLVGGGGIAAMVTGVAKANNGASAPQARVVDTSQRDSLAAMLHDLVASSKRLDGHLVQARHDLARQTRALQHQRSLSRVALSLPPASTAPTGGATSTGSGSDAAGTGQAQTQLPSSVPTTPPPIHASTGASGGSATSGTDDDNDTGSDEPDEGGND